MYAPRALGWAGSLRAGPALVRTRIEDNVARHGLDYPWWVPVLSFVGQVTCVVVALVLRDAVVPPEAVVLTVVLVTWPAIFQLVVGQLVPWWLEFGSVAGATVWLLSDPVTALDRASSTSTLTPDTAPAILALLTAEVVAREGVRLGATVAALSAVVVVVAAEAGTLTGSPVHLVDLLLGFVIGGMLRAQMRALTAERAARATERQRATLAERQRIAREIHDLVAHSLSVTLLHITGARHALRDAEVDPAGLDVAEVDAALADAEQVGRRAMADIRQTVSTLTEGPADAHPLPGATDIGGLVRQMELAGLDVGYAEEGDPTILAQGTGLGLYRIAQESLANIAKHAPRSRAQVHLSVRPRLARLTVRNGLPDDHSRRVGADPDGGGSGLDGMQARAVQLGGTLVAGPEDDQWLVDLRLPLEQREGELWCGRMLPRILR